MVESAPVILLSTLCADDEDATVVSSTKIGVAVVTLLATTGATTVVAGELVTVLVTAS